MNESSRIGDRLLLQLFFDLRLSTFFDADVVDDLDALALLHVVDDHLADDAVRVAHIAHLDDEVVEEVRRPQPLEVGERRLLRGVVVREPLVRSTAGCPSQLHVIEVGVGLDDRAAALLFEAQHHGGQERADSAGGSRLARRRADCRWSPGDRAHRTAAGRTCGRRRAGRRCGRRRRGWRLRGLPGRVAHCAGAAA